MNGCLGHSASVAGVKTGKHHVNNHVVLILILIFRQEIINEWEDYQNIFFPERSSNLC